MSAPNDIARLGSAHAGDTTAAERPAAQAQSPEQLKLLAAQFEALLMGQMLKQMQSSMFDDDSDSGFAKGPLGDALYSELGLSLGRAGGMGLSDALLGPLLRQASQLGATSLDTSGLDAAAGGIDLDFGSATPLSVLPTAFPLEAARPSAFALGPVSSAFGWRSDPLSGAQKFHKGTDIAMPAGQEVPVATGGRVAFAGEQSGYGLTVLVDHGNGLSTRYGHLSEISVSAGAQVKEGQTIGKSGASGRATGPHLHFEVLEHGQPVDPKTALARIGTSVQVTD